MKFVCWLWRGHDFNKVVAKYDERHVHVLSNMLRRHGGHELVCVHDGTFHPDVPSIVMPPEVVRLTDYLPKLWGWSREFGRLIGGKYVSIDLDVVITGDLGPVVQTDAPFMIWNRADLEPYNSSLFVLQPGYGKRVWQTLSVDGVARARARVPKWCGDQSWIAHVLGPHERTFGEETGVIQYRPRIHRQSRPPFMKAGFMCGPYEPFSEKEQSPWLSQEYH